MHQKLSQHFLPHIPHHLPPGRRGRHPPDLLSLCGTFSQYLKVGSYYYKSGYLEGIKYNNNEILVQTQLELEDAMYNTFNILSLLLYSLSEGGLIGSYP